MKNTHSKEKRRYRTSLKLLCLKSEQCLKIINELKKNRNEMLFWNTENTEKSKQKKRNLKNEVSSRSSAPFPASRVVRFETESDCISTSFSSISTLCGLHVHSSDVVHPKRPCPLLPHPKIWSSMDEKIYIYIYIYNNNNSKNYQVFFRRKNNSLSVINHAAKNHQISK